MGAKNLGLYLSIFLLFFPLKIAFGSEFRKADSAWQKSIQVNKSLPTKISTPDPPRENPRNPGGGGGGTRGGCSQDENRSLDLTLLIPNDQARKGLTVAEYPTFFAFVPQTKARKGEFILYDRTDKKVIYRTTFDLRDIPGIVSLQLPKDREALKIDRDYEWRFLLHCKPNDDRSEDVMKRGRIKRVAANQEIAKIQSNANPLEKARIYQKNNLWYDALQTLAEIRTTAASNSDATTMWQELLRSEQRLNEILAYPLVGCCKPVN